MKKNLKLGLLAFLIFISFSSFAFSQAGGAAANEAGSHWIYIEGNEISPSVINGAARSYPAYIMGESTSNSRCMFNGSLYESGYAMDVGSRNNDLGLQFEAGTWSGDVEICANTGEGENVVTGGPSRSDNYLGGDHGGEWTDPDTNALTQAFPSGQSDGWEKWWIENTPDAHPSTWDGEIGGHGMSGFAVEDDCGPQPCDDIGTGKGFESPFALNPEDAFTEGAGDDDHPERGHAEITGESPSGGLDNLHNRVQAGNLGSGSYTGVGSGNTQDQENAPPLSWDENSHIDPKDDEWALTPSLGYAIDYDGTPYATGQCYGAPREQGVDKTKDQAVYANSYAYAKDVYSGGRSGGLSDGIWINPDDLDLSVLNGGYTCDLTGDDWGYGFSGNVGTINCEDGNCDIEGDPSSSGDEGVVDSFPHAIEGEMVFDYEDDPLAYHTQDNLQQYPDACGDDQNEYLIREHAASFGGENNPEFDGRNDYYGCADRKTDCVFQGEIYSQGELIDIQDEEAGENGVNSVDEEICVAIDPSIPGGEWVDPDNETARDILIGDGTADDPEYYVRDEIGVDTSDPGKVVWHDGDEDMAARKARLSPYNPIDYETGYALEDDCDSELKYNDDTGCDDSRFDEELIQGQFVYNPFEAGIREDDANVFDGYSMRTLVAWGPSDSFSGANGATTEQDQENVDGSTSGVKDVTFDSSDDFPTSKLNDSTINLREDNWAISKVNNAVGPTGRVWEAGSCYGMSPLNTGSRQGEYKITKNEKVMGNSLAATTSTSFGEQRGVWINPDSHINTTLEAGLSCNLNGNDWGIGFNNGSGLYVTDNDTDPRYEAEDLHVATGNITFDINSDPNNIGDSRNLQQYPDACGDDQNEYLIREHMDSAENTEQEPNLGRENIYACADRISDCAFHGEVYSEGQLVDVQKYGREEVGSDSVDEEVCVDVDESVPGGEWMDVDNESLNELLKGDSYTEDDSSTYNGLVRANASYSGNGIKWFTDNYDPAAEGEISPYHELDYSDGYALEDDVGPNVSFTSDEGLENEYFTPDAVYSYFEDGHITDDRLNSTVETGDQREILLGDTFTGVSRRMMVGFANGTVYTDHGKSNNQDTEGVSDPDFDSTEFGFPTQKLNDSTINEDEDTWAIVNSTETLVGPTGRAYPPGKCYGRHVMDQPDFQVEKNEKVVGNSFAMAVDVPDYKTDSVPEDFKWGTWVNPDSTPLSATEGNMSCDLNATDWGYGYNFAGEADIELTSTRINGDVAEASFYNWKTGRTHVFSNDTDGTDTIRGVKYSLYRIGGLESDSQEAVIKEGAHNPSNTDLTSFNCNTYTTASDEKKACNEGEEFTQNDPNGILDLENVRGDVRSYGYDEDEPHVVMGEITFDINSDPNGFGESENLEQYPDACGDDPNEYLIREHVDSADNTEQRPNLDRNNTYVCADRISDCAFHGEVYSEGQLADIQRYGNEEQGKDSIDEEVCVDVDKSVPGGEWYDVDNESLNQFLKGRKNTYVEDDPSTYSGLVRDNASYDGEGVKWFTDNYEHAREVEVSPFNPLNYSDGYALEDDVGPGVNYSADEGKDEEQFTPDAVYTFFEEAHREDDRISDPNDDSKPDPSSDYFEGISVRMFTGFANGTASAEHGATNNQDQENVPSDTDFSVTKWGETVNLNDSTIDPKEDTWAIANRTDAIVGPTGKIYQPGKCYGQYVLDQFDLTLNKSQKAVGNSYAMSVDVNGDGDSRHRGVWVNPDSTPESVRTGNLTCELNSTDWGIGYNLGSEENLEIIRGAGSEFGDVREQGYDKDDPHAVLGDVKFENKIDRKDKSSDNSKDTEIVQRTYENKSDGDSVEFNIGGIEKTDINVTLMPGDNPSPEPVQKWISDVPWDSVHSAEDIEEYKQLVYASGVDVAAMNKTNGEEVWRYDDFSTPHEIGIDQSSDIIYVAGTGTGGMDQSPGQIHALNPESGELIDIHEYAESPGIVHAMEVNDKTGIIHIGGWGEEIYSYDPSSDKIINIYDDGPGITDLHDLEIDEESGILYAAFGHEEPDETETEVHAIDTDTYTSVWEWHPGDMVISVQSLALGKSEEILYAGRWGGWVSVLNSSDGEVKWVSKTDDTVLGVDIDSRGNGYATGWRHSPTLASIDSSDGSRLWTYEGHSDSLKDVTVDKSTDTAYTLSSDNETHAVQSSFNEVINPALSLESQEVSHDGTLLDDESYSDKFTGLGHGNYEGEVSTSEGLVDIKLEWSETKDSEKDEKDGNDGDYDEELPPQYGESCGDDRYEYLIREHNTTDPEGYQDEHNPALQRDNIYVCATDVSACALNGTVYQEGELADVQANDPEGANEEQGVDSIDEEVCVDVDKSVPGGEWMDVDNESINEILKGSHTEDDIESYDSPFVRNKSDYSGDGVVWFTDEFEPAKEVENSPYNPLDYSDGYALEDDCADNVQYCSDEGPDEQHFTPDAVYSYFEEGRPEDDANVFEGRSVQMYVGYANGTAYSDYRATNGQDKENTDGVVFDSSEFGWPTSGLNDSTIDPLEDTWAISAELEDPVGPTGKVWEEGKCYGRNAWNVEKNWTTKDEKVVANSYAMGVDVNGYPPENPHYDTSEIEDDEKGVWVNPDSTVNSAVTGGYSCDLNATDWGYGYNTGEGDSLQVIQGEVRENGFNESNPHVVAGDIVFDMNSDPYGDGAEENLQQYPDACGDDQNEFLIREHGLDPRKTEHGPSLTDHDIYACADRPTDCVYNGEVYSMGQVKDISGLTDETPAEELGSDSIDAEVCVDTDPDLPGGEWVDADNHTVYEKVIGSGTAEQPETYDGFPTTVKRGGDVRWYNTSYNESLEYPVAEAYNSPYNDNVTWKAGYAFEDDVGERVEWADDSGATETRIKGKAVYTHYEAGKKSDDRNIGDGYVLRMFVNGSAEHGARNNQEDENVFENLPQLNDSTIDENEDTWAIGAEPYYAVGPTGHVYKNGSCYGRFNSDIKAGTVVANSFAFAHDVDGDGQKEGDWVNPDHYEEAILRGAGTCSLGTVDDWGLGFNNESKDELRFVRGESEGRSLGYETSPSWQSQLVSGPITFDNRSLSGDSPGVMVQDDLPQFTDSCGDDQNEILVREHSSLTKDLDSNKSDEHLPNLDRQNIYVCADRVSDCAFNGSVYSEGQLADVSGDREIGNSSQDLEVCIDSDKRIPGGEWHDIDNSTWNQYLKGDPGDYIEDRPETYEHLVANNTSMRNHWFTDDNVHADEVEISPYNHLNYSDGYALEDDCSEGVKACADIGNDTQKMPGEAVYSAFKEDEGEDDFNVLDGRAVRLYVGYANGTAWASHGATNNQSEENAGDLNFTVPVPEWHVNAGNSDAPISLNDSTIDTREDTWAIANRTDAVVGPTGEVYMDGKCYGGQPNYSEEGWITKNETVMANSLAYSMEANADENNEGVWINPDSTNETLLDGEFSCDLNATDWGMGYDMGPSSELVATMTSEANIRDSGYEASDPHAVAGPIQFDIESDPGEKDQMDEPQFPSACGDDQNEYLIREHGTDTGNEFRPNLSRDNIYGCTDRLSDCVYNGEVYSEGQTVDISGAAAPGEDPEKGDDIADEEICLDLDSSIPGGEFYDKDNNWTTESRIKELSDTPEETWDRVEYFQDKDFGENPGSDWKNKTHLLDKENTSYFNNSGTFDQNYDQYSPIGYATEDDCGPVLSRLGTGPCGDVGSDVQNISWFSAGNFSFVPSNPDMQEGTPQDNYDTGLGFKGRHNKIDDDSDQFEPGAATQRNWNLTDVYGADYRIYDTEDSTPGPDKWALTRYLNYSIDNRGNAYRPATEDRSGCFYRSDVTIRTDLTDDGVMKTDKIFGNSLAVAEDYDGDSDVEGVWKDPDDAAVKYANFTCDITGPDKGYGYDTGDDDGNFEYKNNDVSTHVVEGDIAFSSIEGKKGAFEQEPPVCGDDHKEFLLEELGEVVNSQSNTGRWGCGTDRDDCVSRSGGEFALYREGDVVNTEEAAENFGRSKFDEEVCMQRSQDTYGVWYDQDYSKDLCQVNNLYGSAGIRWLDAEYIDTHPYSVAEGINDDLNPYLFNRRSDFNESTQGNVTDYLSNTNDRSPVPTGKWVNRSVDQYYSDFGSFSPSDQYLNLTATKGFCGGDDEGENVVVQQSSTDLIETNFSVIGIADNPDDCVLDGANIDAVEHDKRQLYSPGDEVSLDFGQSTRSISCFAGQWFANWPVTFVDRNISIEEETTANIQFKVVNVRNTRTTYEVELDADSEIEDFTQFTDQDGNSFTTTVPAESTESHSLEVYGQDSSIGPVNITLDAQSLTGDIQGSDDVTVNVVDSQDAEGTAQSVDEVPGIGFLQLIVMWILSTLIYYRRFD